MLDIW